ncbi:hypothetical protein [Gilvibacter sediminis]|uniref:hypothetical protein n=1 Tax=Gilvibacter sediminis TaxID=379071 RepID=UPI00234FF3F6|nr:hypothetical protein [Gilvibacter sediminis]MDC7999324.1 hypothetical protein [Gilvibacter sediminis]
MDVYYNDTTGHYKVFDENGEHLTVRFTSWQNNKAMALEIISNGVPGMEILRVDGVIDDSCINIGKKCNDLQFKWKNSLSSTPNGATFNINNACDFKDTQTQLIQYSGAEVSDGTHNNLNCGDCYNQAADIPIPDTVNGNILVGKKQ